MSWVRIDDGFTGHRKVLPLSDAAFRLEICALCWCNQQSNDGLISDVDVRVLGGYLADPGTAKDAVKELVAASLWEVAPPGGYQLHDYTKYQPTAAHKKESNDRAAHRMQAMRDRKSSYSVTDDVTRHVTQPVTDDVTSREVLSSRPVPSRPFPKEKTIMGEFSDKVQNSDFLRTWEFLCQAIPELKPTRKHADRMGGEISTGLPGALHAALVADWGALMKSDPPPSKKDFLTLTEWLRAGGLHYLQRTEWTAYVCKNLPAALDKASMWDKGGRSNPAAKVQAPPSVRVPSKTPALDPAVVAIRERMRKLEDPEEQAKIAALLAASDD